MDYDSILLEQYKLYVSTADDITKRRIEVNKLYLTILLALFTISGFLNSENISTQFSPYIILVLLSIIGFTLSLIWYVNIESYKQLNTAKFKVIHEMESKLPHKCFDDEWNYLNKGRDHKIYVKLTYVEKFMPLLMGVLFILIFCITVWNHILV